MRLGGVPLAWRNLTHDKRRFAVSLTGIAFAVLLMFVELGFGVTIVARGQERLRQAGEALRAQGGKPGGKRSPAWIDRPPPPNALPLAGEGKGGGLTGKG